MGKLFGKAPSDYFDLDDNYFNLAIDYACAIAHWQDENMRYKQSQDTAQQEAVDIGRVLEEYKEELSGRN